MRDRRAGMVNTLDMLDMLKTPTMETMTKDADPQHTGPPHTGRSRGRWLLLAAVVLGVASAAAAAGAISNRLRQPYRGYAEAERFIEIVRGSSGRAIGEQLATAGIVRDEWTFRLAMWRGGDDRILQAGEYRFAEPMTPAAVIDTLVRGDVYLIPITFPEGLDLEEMANQFGRSDFGTATDFLAAARDPSSIADVDPDATDLEGYLFPDTYRVPRSATAADIVASMVRGFRQAFGPELRAAAEAAGYTPRQVVALASLIEKETARDEERAMVAAVYRNRLDRRMGLQCDPTVIYALKRAGQYDGNLTRADLQFDSPYNTYRYAGLPPGPIASPGKASIEAALAPADVSYLYFVSRNDGSHVFASTLGEHNRNVQEFQVRYFRERRARARP